MIAAAGLTLVECRRAVVEPPPDPESLDATRPADLDVCEVCSGDGTIQIGWDEDPHECDGDECWGCAGTGRRGAA